MESDTLDDVPNAAMSVKILDEILLSRLKHFAGVVFTGLASPEFGGDVEWGRVLQLNSEETLQLRLHPRGIVSAGRLVDMRRQPIMMASRRRSQSMGKDFVSFAVLWHPECDLNMSFSAFDYMKQTSQSIAARNLHVVLPSLFNHHDAQYGGCPEGSRAAAKWPVLDECNYHCLRSTSFTLHRQIKLENGQNIITATASAGISQFVIAGHFANADVKDSLHRPCEPLSYTKWLSMLENYASVMREKCGFKDALTSMHNAMTVADLLTCEGLIGIVGQRFSDGGAIPDMMHMPSGFPLLIAMACRIACYPERFGLVKGIRADQLANRELVALFEGNWKPVSATKAADGGNIYAIDIALVDGVKEARMQARLLAQESVSQTIEEHIAFWHRAGQRCVTAIFGPQPEDFFTSQTSFGAAPERLVDPLTEARNGVMRTHISATEAVAGTDGHVATNLATVLHKRNLLMMIMNSVEHWLRTGTYCNIQLNKRNDAHFQRRLNKKMMKKTQLMESLSAGMEFSVKEMLRNGDAKSEAEARESAQKLHDSILEQVKADMERGDGEVDGDTLYYTSLQSAAPVAASAGSGGCDVDVDRETICVDAFKSANSVLSAAMCQGPMVHLQFSMGAFLSSVHAINKCADCDADVHLLTATFLSSAHSACERCDRSRCVACTDRAQQLFTSKAPTPDGVAPVRHCLRCKPAPKTELDGADSPAPQTAPARARQAKLARSAKKRRGGTS